MAAGLGLCGAGLLSHSRKPLAPGVSVELANENISTEWGCGCAVLTWRHLTSEKGRWKSTLVACKRPFTGPYQAVSRTHRPFTIAHNAKYELLDELILPFESRHYRTTLVSLSHLTMDSTHAWPGGLPNQGPSFGTQYDLGQSSEDWEDWLKWDPAAEPISPEDSIFHSASSKNDSPLQAPAIPANTALFGKAGGNDTLAPPLIVGEDALDFDAGDLQAPEPFSFGNPDDAAASFDFNAASSFQPVQPEVLRLDTTWPLPQYDAPQSVNLAALSNEYMQQPLSAVSQPVTTPSLHHSPESSQNRTGISETSTPPDPPKKRGGRKRKVEIEEEQQDENSGSQEDGEPPAKKGSHNVIEKRYRNNLNDKIVELRNSVPSLRAMDRANGGKDTEDLGGLTPAHKLNKATVMGKATEYIKHLEKRNNTMADEMATLKARLAAVEEAIGKSSDRQASMSNSPPSSTGRPRQASSSSQASPQTFLNVPQEQLRYGQPVMQQQYMQQQPQPMYARPPGPPVNAQNQPQYAYGRGGGVVNKVMMGAMAGMMVIDGFTGPQGENDPRGLSAGAVTFWKRGLDLQSASTPAAFARQAGLPLLKICFVVGVLFYLLSPLLTFSPRRKQKTRPAIRLPPIPSLASPVEVRRKAWLTAIQTVYVPKHFLLEVAAVRTKMASLSLRRLIGSDLYNAALGITKDEEAARIKAWDIAIDAQLAGGDQEVSYYRLLLTLMASGTLPDSPTRLMQKAVHFRVFFWEVAHAGYGNMVGFKQFTEKVGKFYWESARKLQKELVHAKAQGRPSDEDEVELLPDHLASLVELDCDDVLGDEMIQRAWNMAWDKPSAYGITANFARDSVVEDHAIRSPLDAVAAWYTNMTLDDTLADALSEHPSSLDAEYYLGLAISVAPPASGTQVRALTAKAVLSNQHREANILAALETLPVSSPGSGSAMNLVNHVPVSPDVHAALTLAKLLSLTTPSAPSSARRRAFDVLGCMQLAPYELTLLTAVAAYKLLRTVSAHAPRLPLLARHGVEDLSGALRLWAGTSAGAHAGLDDEERGRMVDVCLAIAKEVGGWDGEKDSGYGSVEASPVRARAEMALS